MRILVTGGAGFIGSHVVDAYLAAGHDVAVVDNLSTGLRENLNPAARFYEADVTDVDRMKEIVLAEKPDVVNHHAAQVNIRVSVANPVFDTHVNVVGTVAVLEAAARAGTKKFIFISSGGAVYGEAPVLPTPEDVPASPISHYGAAKLAGERYCHVYYVTTGMPYTILRYSNVYGPRQNPDGEAGVTAIFANKLLKGEQPVIFGDGSKTRDYVHVSDVAAANLIALERGDLGVFNIGTGRRITDQQVFEAIARVVGYQGSPIYDDFRPGEVMHSCLDWTRAQKILGWRPAVEFEEGVASVVEYNRHTCKSAGPGVL
ncbi:MAG: NAD-dependent epimerase/dehydratase family protein [Armatimonadetes bacterium]|nr:NAD-dependent epimerase/dehydratase family protein [Armatimonadota bacterium]